MSFAALKAAVLLESFTLSAVDHFFWEVASVFLVHTLLKLAILTMSKGAASTGGGCRWSSLSKAFARTTSKNLDTKNTVLRARGIAAR